MRISWAKKQELLEKKPIHIAVEGANFFHFLRERISGEDEIYGNIYLHDFKEEFEDLGQLGRKRWLGLMESQLDREFIKGLAIICDAEYDRIGTIASVKNEFDELFSQSLSEGVVFEDELKLGFLIVPLEDTTGCLEHAMWRASPDSEIKSCSEDFVSCLEENNFVKNDNSKAKVRVRSLIAAKDPDMWFGDTAKTELWDWNHASLRGILDFLAQMNQVG